MRVGIVRMSQLSKLRGHPSKFSRWDAEFYLGKGNKHWDEKLQSAEAQVKAAQTRLENLKTELAEEEARVRELTEVGVLTPLENNGCS